jgi:16S rRNA processing protein RimM
LNKKPPERLVGMGRISAPFGIKGWIRVQPFTDTAGGLTNFSTWWLGSAGNWCEHEVEQSQAQGTDVVAKLAGISDRDVAAGFKGQQVAIPREAFPPADKGEFYWADLVGLRVKNTEGLEFGVVTSMLETGANDVMVVQQSAVDGESAAEERERLIPFIADVVKRVDIAAGLIEVEWGADY